MDKNSTRELIKTLQEFSQRNRVAERFDEEDFIRTFEKLSPFITMVGIDFDNFELIRSRSTQQGLDFEHIKQMGPPPHQRAKLGRCNFEGQPIFYGSSNVETSFLEIGFNEHNSCAVMTQFRLKQEAKLTLQPIGVVCPGLGGHKVKH